MAGHTYFTRKRRGARTSKESGGEIHMVYLNRFLCVDAGILAEPIRLHCVECYMTRTLRCRDCVYTAINLVTSMYPEITSTPGSRFGG